MLFSIDPGCRPYITMWNESGEIIDEYYLTNNPKKSLAERSSALSTQLADLIDEFRPTTIIIEEVLSAAYHLKSRDAVYWLVGSFFTTQSLCGQNNIELKTVNPLTLKKHATGSGRAKKCDMIKAANEIFNECFRPADHNRVDSYLIGRYYFKTKELLNEGLGIL